jgi:hypothetical protein
MQTEWLEKQVGTIQQFEKVSTTFLNEDSGEMHCTKCGESERTGPNPRRSLLAFWGQRNAFEKFTEHHLHGRKVA